MSIIVAHSEAVVKSEKREKAIELLEWMAVESRAEDGVVDYRVAIDIEEPTVLRIIEQYEDAEAFESHESSEHLKRFKIEMEPCLAEKSELTRYTVSSKRTIPGP